MSKSLGNGVDPDEMIAVYGADAARLFVLFAAPVENELRWSESGIEGAIRFLRRVYTLVWRWQDRFSRESEISYNGEEFSARARALRRKTHQTIARITDDFEQLHLNTSVALLMELFNELMDFDADPETANATDAFAVREAISALVVMLAPFCPHIAEELWASLGHPRMLAAGEAIWPVADQALARNEELEIPVQINGKLRARIVTSPEVTEAELRAAVLSDEKVRGHLEGRQVVNVIVVPRRLVNIVLR